MIWLIVIAVVLFVVLDFETFMGAAMMLGFAFFIYSILGNEKVEKKKVIPSNQVSTFKVIKRN